MLIKDIFSQFYRGVESWGVMADGRRYILLIILLFAANGADAEPEIEVIHHYYAVAVDSIDEIESAVEEASPLRGPDKIYHGYTDSQVHWNWWWRRDADLCRISRVESKVRIEYTLPKLEADSRNFQVRGVWSKWFWALKSHENNHGRNAIVIARQGEKAILAVEPHVDCALVDQRASVIAAGLIEALKRRDAEYDKRTNHGELEGGVSDYF